MKEGSSIMIDKPFSCDIDGCSMKFVNEDHLMVHKKRHDMVLNLGLAPKGNTFSDQTPTPTRFIRNCEEVGLFQDLQNVNPFEETFRRAAEAVKTGQTTTWPLLDKSFQSNPPDDTLHTPNIFPHIADLQCVNHSGNLVNQEKQSQDNVPKKEDEDINNDEKELPLKLENEPRKLILGSVSHKKRKTENCDKPLIIELQNDTLNQLTTSESETCQQVVQFSEINPVQLALKEKIKSNLQNKQLPTVIQLKVPIPKSSSTIRYQKSQKDKFSTFSKNSLKYESKLEKSQSGIFDVSKKRRARKSYNGLPKERIEILERNRAAATRCREKKKSYISYLEKLSRELTEANKKLQIQNMHLRKQISLSQSELLKHKNCNVTLSKGNKVLTALANVEHIKDGEIALGTEDTVENPIVESTKVTMKEIIDEDNPLKCGDNFGTVTTVFDTVEVSINENSMDNETNSTRLLCEEDRLRKVYTDHSYSNFLNTVEARKKSLTPKMIKSKVNANLLSKDIKFQRVMDKNNKESFNVSLLQGFNPGFTTFESTEPLVIFPQPGFVLKAPISRKPDP